MKRALLVLAACARPVPHVELAPPAPTASWSLEGLHVTGAPPLDHELGKRLEGYDDAIGYRMLDLSDVGALVERGGELEWIRHPGAKPVALTPYEYNVDWATFSGTNAVFTSDQDGDEHMRLFSRNLAPRGAPTRLFAAHDQVFDPIVADDGIAWWSERAADGTWRIVSSQDHVIAPGRGRWTLLDFTRDATALARFERDDGGSALVTVDLTAGTAMRVTPIIANEVAPGGAFGASGVVYAICTCGADVTRLVRFDGVGSQTVVAAAATQVAVAPDGSLVAFTVDDDGASILRLYDPSTGATRDAKVPARGVITDLRYSRVAGKIAFSLASPSHPRDAYSYDPATDRLEAWTHAEPGISAPVEPTHETIAIVGQQPIHALVFRPGKIAGVVVELHGGPEDRFVPGWDPWVQALVARGYAVVQPNVRGSSGYGRHFAQADDGPHRMDALRDVGAVIDWAAQMHAPIAVIGTSYGGMLALDALAQFPGKLAAGVALSPITDIPAFLAGTADYRADNRRAEYGDERDPKERAALAAISPIAHAADIKAPVLVAHGARDPRVPIEQVDRFVAAARKTTQVWYARADDEGHIFSKTANRAVVETLTLQLLASAFRSR